MVTNVPWLMTLHAGSVGAGAKLRVGWMDNAVIAVTYDASGKRSSLKCLIVRALFVHLGLENVTGRANVLNFVYSRRRRAVVSMTRRTSRRTQISSHSERVVMDASAVLGELICRNRVSLHVVRIGMAATTSLRHIDWIDR